MKSPSLVLLIAMPLSVVFLAIAPAAQANTIWYVNGMSGSDSNACTAAADACKTIGHAISLAVSGDSIMVAAATYSENLNIGKNLTLIGTSATTTSIDGGARGTVITVSNTSANVTLSRFTIYNGRARYGGGIYNTGTLTIITSVVASNAATFSGTCVFGGCGAGGAGIWNMGALTINGSSIVGNSASTPAYRSGAAGGGISNGGLLTINSTTISGNSAKVTSFGTSDSYGGGISNSGTVVINNTTLTSDTVFGDTPTTTGGGGVSNGEI
jgi:hypothetical protein